MKPLFLVPIVAGLVMIPSSGLVNTIRDRSPADVYTQSVSEQMRVPSRSGSVAELRAAEYADRYTAYDEHHEVVQTSGHSGIIGPKMRM